MRGRDLFLALLQGAGFYKRKMLFFLLLALLGVAAGFLWQNERQVEATVEFSNLKTDYAGQVKMEVEVTAEAKVFINGQKNNKAIKFYKNFDEVRILVYDSPGYYIQNFQSTITLPKPEASNVRQLIYAIHGVGSSSYYVLDSQTLFYEVTDIAPQAGVTIVADLPKGMVQPGWGQRLAFYLSEWPIKSWIYAGIILPLVTVVLMLFMLIKRRVAQIFFLSESQTVMPSKDPPAVVGVLVDGVVGAREIAATLIDLARRGFILIVNKGNGEFSFGKLRGKDIEKMTGLLPLEKHLLSKIFLTPAYKSTLQDVEMRIGRHIFSRKIAQFYLGVYNFATKKGYFIKNPAKVHLAYKYTGIGLLFLSLAGFALGAVTGADPKFGLIFWVGGMMAAFFIIKLSSYMPARSKLGTAELKKWLGFRRYLTSKQKLQAKDVLQQKFEEYLPYAVVLGAEVDWANKFLKEPFVTPPWYESAERALILEKFVGDFFPLIGYVAENLAKSHEPTVE